MNLAQMFSLATAKSYFSRPSAEVYAALDQGGYYVYTNVLKEYRGFFLQISTTAMTLTPGMQEYTMPADLTQIVHLAERQSSTQNWRPMRPINAEDAFDNIQLATGWNDETYGYGENSMFGFYGPFLDSPDAQNPEATQLQKIQVSPAVDTPRMCELIYTAKWMPIVDSNSAVMLPDEGCHAMLNYGIAELLRSNNDALADKYEVMGDKALTMFLTWVRNRQIERFPTIKTYGPSF